MTFSDVELRLYASRLGDDFLPWRCDVRYRPTTAGLIRPVLGQSGFLDQFTVASHLIAARRCWPSKPGKRLNPASGRTLALTQ